MTDSPAIRIRGARQHNLKNLNIEVPLNRFTVISGVSGSGKSSLAFDTLYAEGQRRYVETFSPYARQFMDRMDHPLVDAIEGIPPAIAIDQKEPIRTSRSTVGTMTEVTDYVKLLFHRMGVLHCPACDRPVRPETAQEVWRDLEQLPSGADITITFPFALDDGDSNTLADHLRRIGYDRVLEDGRLQDISDIPPSHEMKQAQVVADRFRFDRQHRERIIDSLEQAFGFGGGRLTIWRDRTLPTPYSRELGCAACGRTFGPPTPNLFSFNSPVGACDTCRGFGRVIGMDPELIIPDSGLTIEEGAIKPWGIPPDTREEYDDLMAFCRREGIRSDDPFSTLPKEHQRLILEGGKRFYGVKGFFDYLERRSYKMHVRVFLSRYRSYTPCPSCDGTRFKPAALSYRINGRRISDLYSLTVSDAAQFLHALQSPDEASGLILSEIRNRLSYLLDVGVGYLTLDRQSRTLSGGEVQRVGLASALGSDLVNTLYVLDEPSIGLHPRDTKRLTGILKNLRDRGNTVVVVEHDPDLIKSSDHLIDLGPEAGEKGGRLLYSGPTARVTGSITGEYLTGSRRIPIPERREVTPDTPSLTIRGASAHNLKSVDIHIPLNRFVCLTGVSGSGKSTLAEEILFKAIKREKGDPQGRPGHFDKLEETAAISDVVFADQRAIGRTPRANLLTYTKALDPVRKRFAATVDAKERGLDAGYFSFNIDRGRCPVCKGDGFEKIEMQFLSDLYVTCPACKGRRFKPQVLEVRYQGRTIEDVFQMTVREAMDFFDKNRGIMDLLAPLLDVGLGYMRLGQPLSTLSGGEAQRLRLSTFLQQRKLNPRLFIFDEPTTGLHLHDTAVLLQKIEKLLAAGHSLLVIEHNMDVVKTADWIIDLGPEGGDAGGRVVVTGTPETVAACEKSHTGHHLKRYLFFDENRLLPAASLISETQAQFRQAHAIQVTGAREHNLKNLDLSIPLGQLVCLTGVSGSGKSSLAFDILFAEGQRRYLESLTPYVRQFVQVLERPEVDLITGLPPAVAIEQRVSHAGRRSTVATLTEIYHFLRLLFSKVGTYHCPRCGKAMTPQTTEGILDEVISRFSDSDARVLAPKVTGRKGYHKELLNRFRKKGFSEARIDGLLTPLTPGLSLDRYRLHTIELVIHRFSKPVKEKASGRSGKIFASSVEWITEALEEGNGTLVVWDSKGKDHIFSTSATCPDCQVALEPADPRLFSFNTPFGACPVCEGLGEIASHETTEGEICSACGGSRLNSKALAIMVNGRSIWDIIRGPSSETVRILESFTFAGRDGAIAKPVLSEIFSRIRLLNRLGLGYLSLGRSGATLSGGEAQRVRLSAQLGSNLTGVLYILDEPTIGLHPRDNALLIDALKRLRDRGNSILVVEHDEETIRAADTLIDLGPGAGRSGGELVAMGTLADLNACGRSVTANSLDPSVRSITSKERPYKDQSVIGIEGASIHNLKEVNVSFPLHTLICITGVSGSGKSSLMKGVLYRALREHLQIRKATEGPWRRVTGWENVSRILDVDHKPIGRTPRSVPASYVGFLDEIRKLFSQTREARAKGYKPGRFSFNTSGGRCEACKGQGTPKVEMSFLPDVYVPCEVCGGSRYNAETLSVTYRGKTISQVLEASFDEAAEWFAAVPAIAKPVNFVRDIGLGYLTLGQPSPTLSGGEAQRIKLAEQLAKPGSGHTVYILDEPSTGLHLFDVRRLIEVLQQLVEFGNTVVVIEHNPEMMAAADYIIDMGPEGGADGGRVVAAGSPREMVKMAKISYTAEYLKAYLTTS